MPYGTEEHSEKIRQAEKDDRGISSGGRDTGRSILWDGNLFLFSFPSGDKDKWDGLLNENSRRIPA